VTVHRDRVIAGTGQRGLVRADCGLERARADTMAVVSRILVLLVGLAGCERVLGIDHFGVADGGAPADTPPDGPICFTGLVKSCLQPTMTSVEIFGSIDTSSDARCAMFTQTNGPELCIISGDTVTVSGATTVVGARPLVLEAATTLQVDATLDASTVTGGQIGAAAQAISCASDAPLGKNGAGGGSFGSVGGDGGTGSPAGPVITPTIVRGGCAGGGDGFFVIGGDAGGAVYLQAGMRIAISSTGAVFASGAGGVAGGGQSGAGGGGSGGMIGLDAPTIDVVGIVAANGGGGGKGGDANAGSVPGESGHDGSTLQYSTPASGGTQGATGGGRGGDGAAAELVAQGGVGAIANGAGGGGGGGGAGVVWVHGSIAGGQISPAPSLH
jgi:hypothetical protein